MAKYVFQRVVNAETVKGLLEKELGTTCRLEVKKNRIEIVQDAVKGCALLVKEKDGKTICTGPYGYMPSGGLRAAIVIGALAPLFVIGLSVGYLVVGIGAIPAVILVLLMKVPSRDLVRRVAGIMERLVEGT